MQSYQVGALPLINRILERMRLREILSEHLPPDDPRLELPTVSSLLVLVRNVLLSRQPVYGVAEWAAGFAPDLFDLWPEELSLLHDDRLGRALDRLFDSVGPELILAVVKYTGTPPSSLMVSTYSSCFKSGRWSLLCPQVMACVARPR